MIRLVIISSFIQPRVCWDPEEFSFASYLLTQNALTDAPERYANFLDEFQSYVNSQTWSDYSDGSGCHDHIYIHTSEASQQITLNDNTLSITITATGLLTTAKFTVTAGVPVYYQVREEFIFCFSWTVCSNVYVNVNFIVDTSTMVDFRWNQTSESISIVPTQVSAVIEGIVYILRFIYYFFAFGECLSCYDEYY